LQRWFLRGDVAGACSSNRFGMPLGLFVGVNEHGHTVLLAQCLTAGETVEDYEWALACFIDVLGVVVQT
jgi:hypothetical protein